MSSFEQRPTYYMLDHIISYSICICVHIYIYIYICTHTILLYYMPIYISNSMKPYISNAQRGNGKGRKGS